MSNTNPPFDPFLYRARLARVVDGDTYDLVVDLGFHITRRVRVRLLDVDTAEIYGTEKESDEYQRGVRHQRAAEEWFVAAERDATARSELSGAWPLLVSTRTTGKYGRYLADVRMQGDCRPEYSLSLGEHLVSEFPDVASES